MTLSWSLLHCSSTSDDCLLSGVKAYVSPLRLRAAFEMYRELPANEKFNAAHRDAINVLLVLAGRDRSFGKVMKTSFRLGTHIRFSAEWTDSIWHQRPGSSYNGLSIYCFGCTNLTIGPLGGVLENRTLGPGLNDVKKGHPYVELLVSLPQHSGR
jgi:hypothetical protein